MIGEKIFEWTAMLIWVSLRTLYEWIKENLFGIKYKEKIDQRKREKKLLYKNIRLTKNQKNGLKSGLNGVILEVVDKEYVFAEFYDLNGKLVELNNELVYKIGIDQFELKK